MYALMMFHAEPKINLEGFSQDNFRNRFIWSSLAFQSGLINSAAFLACHRFVTHTTGFATQFGADLALFKGKEALSMLIVPVFFLLGSMTSAYYVDRQIQLKKQAQYHVIFFWMTFFFLVVLILGLTGHFSAYGESMSFVSEITLVSLLCFSSGLQNAAVSTASNNFVRTTHLTGITTDLGVGLIRQWTGHHKNEIKANQVRLILISSFILGSALGAALFLNWKYLTFLIPFLVTLILYFIARKEWNKHDRLSK